MVSRRLARAPSMTSRLCISFCTMHVHAYLLICKGIDLELFHGGQTLAVVCVQSVYVLRDDSGCQSLSFGPA